MTPYLILLDNEDSIDDFSQIEKKATTIVKRNGTKLWQFSITIAKNKNKENLKLSLSMWRKCLSTV
jgi:hypothetical protein